METNKLARRQALKAILAAAGGLTAAAFLPSKWLKPVVNSGVLPAHAQTSAHTMFDVNHGTSQNGIDAIRVYVYNGEVVGTLGTGIGAGGLALKLPGTPVPGITVSLVSITADPTNLNYKSGSMIGSQTLPYPVPATFSPAITAVTGANGIADFGTLDLQFDPSPNSVTLTFNAPGCSPMTIVIVIPN